MKIKINKQIEAGLLAVIAMIVGVTTYTETNRLTGHFMQVKTTQLVSYRASPAVRPKLTYVARTVQPVRRQETVAIATPTTRPTVQRQRVYRAASSEPTKPEDDFPSFGRAIYPVSKTPNWGHMTSEQEWERIYAEMNADDFVPVPAYNMSELTIPMRQLTRNRSLTNNDIITNKLFYSTRYFGTYDLDSDEYQGRHVGIDMKVAAGTPVGSVAGGVVHATGTDDALGNYVMVLHRLPESGTEVVSVYGHLDSVTVAEGRAVAPGTIIGYAGSTGNSKSPHIHLQIDYKKNPGRHVVYVPGSDVSVTETSKWTLHPIEFIARW